MKRPLEETPLKCDHYRKHQAIARDGLGTTGQANQVKWPREEKELDQIGPYRDSNIKKSIYNNNNNTNRDRDSNNYNYDIDDTLIRLRFHSRIVMQAELATEREGERSSSSKRGPRGAQMFHRGLWKKREQYSEGMGLELGPEGGIIKSKIVLLSIAFLGLIMMHPLWVHSEPLGLGLSKELENLQLKYKRNNNPHELASSGHKTSLVRTIASHTPIGKATKPDSSSSFFAPIEDLNDSNIKTKTGVIVIPTQQTILEDFHANKPNPPARTQDQMHQDFDQLLERILKPIESAISSDQVLQKLTTPLDTFSSSSSSSSFNGNEGITVAADMNNKTTMRFFRNSKTFASIVYTNNREDHYAISSGARRKLINCHLVDLERHASDVALFEAKYDIKTIDIEFRDMMRLIDACTDIARFRTQPKTKFSHGKGSHGAGQPIGSSAANHPLYVVGKPVPSLSQLEQSVAQQRQEYQRIMTSALSNELNRLGPTIDDSPKLDLPKSTGDEFSISQLNSSNMNQGSISRQLTGVVGRSQQHQFEWTGNASSAHQLLNSAMSRVNDFAAKRLVLGSINPSTSEINNRQGGLKEAIQEISSYDSTDLMAIWRGILPGTNWCGMGDRATSYNDLGFESDIDICCRAHDFCPVRLSAFSSGYGLFNWSFYTRSHCLCDQNFLDCLQRAESPLSAVVMKLYFKIMKTTCLNDNETNLGDTKFITSGDSNQSPFQSYQLQQVQQQQQQRQQTHFPSWNPIRLIGNRLNRADSNGAKMKPISSRMAGFDDEKSDRELLRLKLASGHSVSGFDSVPALRQSQLLQTKYESIKSTHQQQPQQQQ